VFFYNARLAQWTSSDGYIFVIDRGKMGHGVFLLGRTASDPCGNREDLRALP
jgi:hypothetical protein